MGEPIMPNWCYNTLEITGSSSVVDLVKEKLNKPFTTKHTDIHKVGKWVEVKYSNPVIAFQNMCSHKDMGISDTDYFNNEYYEKKRNEQKDPNYWYEFNTREWGTKWDIGVSDDDKTATTTLASETTNSDGKSLIYTFETAWSPPFPAIQKLSKTFPNLTLTLEYEEETGWGGTWTLINGKIHHESSYGWRCRECGFEMSDMPYCEMCNDVCPKCNYANDIDENCVKHKHLLEQQ